MDGLTFTSDVISAAAWPASALSMAVIFRRDVSKLLRRLRHVEAGGVSSDFDPAVAYVRARSEQKLAATGAGKTTKGLVAAGWSLTDALASADVEPLLRLAQVAPTTAVTEARTLLDRAAAKESPAEDVARLVDQLRRIQDNVVSSHDESLTPDSAADYILTTSRVLALLQR